MRAAVNGEVGADAMPDLFSSYADTAYELEQSGALANLSEYLSKDELAQYVDAYIDEGCIASDGSLRIFPVAKSTETLMLNQTDWEVFAEATGASLDSLRTIEGVVSTAEAYYQWTDSLTETPNDGKALYGRDAMANYFIIGMQQLGTEMFQVEGGEVTLQLPEDALRRLWENYYIPIVMGWFGAYGSFRCGDYHRLHRFLHVLPQSGGAGQRDPSHRLSRSAVSRVRGRPELRRAAGRGYGGQQIRFKA